VIGAIVIACGSRGEAETQRQSSYPGASSRLSTWNSCLASVPILGCSTIVRTVDYLKQNGVDEVSVFGGRSRGPVAGPNACTAQNDAAKDAWRAASRQLNIYRQDGLETVLILNTVEYVECELASFIGQHRQQENVVTRAIDREGTLDCWAVDPQRFAGEENLVAALDGVNFGECEISGYANRLQTPYDLRRLAADLLGGKCRMRPAGTESRPGVWVDEGAQIARGARIVAPVYIGRNVQIADDCLITRSSNIESSSFVDFGTAVEDSSILSNTYIGIGLDLCHSIVDGEDMLNLHHEVRLRITDPVVMRRNSPVGQQKERLVQSEMSAMGL